MQSVSMQGAQGVRLHALKGGGGPVQILFLHGWPGFSYDWRKILPVLPSTHSWIAPDLRGFGMSDRPAGGASAFGPEAHCEDLLAILDRLGTDRLLVVAFDIGATVAQRLARQAPKVVERLLLMNPPYPGIGARRFDPLVQSEFWYQHFHQLPLAPALVTHDLETLRLYLSHFFRHWSGPGHSMTDQELSRYVEVYSQPGAFEASIQYYRARAAEKSRLPVKSADKIEQQTVILWGDQDPVMKIEWADRLGDDFACFQFSPLPGIGHFVPWEAPNRVANEILTLLSTSGVPGSV